MRWLVIPDLQIPFEHPQGLAFCRRLKKEYRIPDEGVVVIGDELDLSGLSSYAKNPNSRYSPAGEILEARERIKGWYAAFPEAKVCTSNHGSRLIRKAIDSEIPSVCMREYREVIEAPEGWQWRKRWALEPGIVAEHGDCWSGPTPHAQAALWLGNSVVMGHHHTKAGIEYLKTDDRQVWGMVVGCLIDFADETFDYARANKAKPVLGAGIILDGKPIFEPFK